MRIWLKLALIIFVLGIGSPSYGEIKAVEKHTKNKTLAQKSKSKSTVKSIGATKREKKPGVAKRAKVGPSELVSPPGSLLVQSGAALVVDQQAGDPLFQKNANKVVPIASITKLMTAMVALDGSPDLDLPVAITEEDVDYLRGSSSRLPVGSVISRHTALLLALMSSENRAAHALARNYPGGIHAFMSAMNTKARSLGMLDTRFEDPTGLTSSNVSTAVDLAKMVAAAYKYQLIREFSTTSEMKVEVGRHDIAYRNTNPLVRNAMWGVGLSKTGYISEAGRCLVMQARVAEKPVVIVLLDSVGTLTRVGDANRIKRWLESVYGSSKHPMHTVSLERNRSNPT